MGFRDPPGFRGRPGLRSETSLRSSSRMACARPNFVAGSRPDRIKARTRAVVTPNLAAASSVVRSFIQKDIRRDKNILQAH